MSRTASAGWCMSESTERPWTAGWGVVVVTPGAYRAGAGRRWHMMRHDQGATAARGVQVAAGWWVLIGIAGALALVGLAGVLSRRRRA